MPYLCNECGSTVNGNNHNGRGLRCEFCWSFLTGSDELPIESVIAPEPEPPAPEPEKAADPAKAPTVTPKPKQKRSTARPKAAAKPAEE